MSEHDLKYARVLIDNDKDKAKNMTTLVDEQRTISEVLNEPIDWRKVCDIIQYPHMAVFNTRGVMREHFRRILIELKTLSIFGKHTFHHFNNVSGTERVY